MNQLIKESIKRLQDKQTKARKEDIAEKFAYYDFDKIALREKVSKYINREETDIPYSLTNITRKVITRESIVYKKAPTRRFESGNGDIYNDLTADKNDSFKTIERITNLIGRPAVKIHLDDGDEKFVYKTIPFFVPVVKLGEIEAVIYQIDNELNEKPLFVYWSKDQHYISNDIGIPIKEQALYGVNEDMINPYGVIPFIYPYKTQPIAGFWVEGATDLIEANEKVNLLLTLLNYLTRYASFKQGYVQGMGLSKQSLSMGYDKLLTLEGEGTIGVLDITADLEQIILTAKFQMETILHHHNLSSDFGEQKGDPSGFALIIKNIDLLDMWEDQVEVWRRHEREAFEIEKIIYKVDTGKSLPDRLQVDYAEVKFPISQGEQREQDEWDLQHDLISRIRIAKRRSPDTPEEDIEKQLEEIKAENLGDKPVKPPVGLKETIEGLSP